MFSSGKLASGLAPASTLMPGRAPAASTNLMSGMPSLVSWRIVSSNRMTPEILCLIASVARNSSSR